MNQILALTFKDLRLLVRDKAGFFFAVFFPLIYCIFFGVVFSGMSGGGGGGSKLPIFIVDTDNTPESAEFIATLHAGKELDVKTTTKEDAEQRVRKGERMAYLVLPPGFGKSRDRMLFGPAPELELGIDPSRQAEAGMLQGLLTQTLFQGMSDLFGNSDKMSRQVKEWTDEITADQEMPLVTKTALLVFLPSLESFMKTAPMGNTKTSDGGDGDSAESGAWNPVPLKVVSVVRQRKGPANSYAITFPQGIIWGVMGCAAGFGISLVSERTSGTLVRLRMSPMGAGNILAGKAGACAIAIIGVCTFLLLIARFGFGVRPFSVPHLVLAVLCITICFVGIMMLLSVLGKTEQSAGGIGWAVLTIMAMIGGAMIPYMFLPSFMQKVSSISPIKWSIVAMEGAIWREFTLQQMLIPCGILVGIGIACFAIGTRAFDWSEAK